MDFTTIPSMLETVRSLLTFRIGTSFELRKSIDRGPGAAATEDERATL